MDAEQKPDPDGIIVPTRNWQIGEIAKLREIVHNLDISMTRNGSTEKSAFFEQVSRDLKQHGWNRTADACLVKWQRLGNTGPRTIWDLSDSEIEYEDGFQSEPEASTNSDYDGNPSVKRPWTNEEASIMYDCIRHQREREQNLQIEPLTAQQLWELTRGALLEKGYNRSTTACRYYWVNIGREKFSLDERIKRDVHTTGHPVAVFNSNINNSFSSSTSNPRQTSFTTQGNENTIHVANNMKTQRQYQFLFFPFS